MEQVSKTAYHEAAHFIAHLLYIAKEYGYWDYVRKDNSVQKVSNLKALSIVPDDDTLGRLQYAPGYSALGFNEERLRVKIAGPVSDYINTGSTNVTEFIGNLFAEQHDWEGSDADGSINLILHYLPEDSNVEDFITPKFNEVLNDLTRHWHIVQSIAERLLEVKEIEGEALDALAFETADKLGITIE